MKPSENITNDNSTYFPRVLIIYMSCLNERDQYGMSLRGWFAQWPREQLAQIYSGGEVDGQTKFCDHTFQIGSRERRFGTVFSRLKRSALGQEGLSVVPVESLSAGSARTSLLSHIRRRVGRFLVKSGAWELLFGPQLSPPLEQWVERFKPDVIYAQGYNLGFARLPLMISKRYGIPIVFHTGDDWPKDLYRRSIAAPILRPIVNQAATNLIRSATVCLSNGPMMSDEYRERYGRDFEQVMMCDNPHRFDSSSPVRISDVSSISIVYAGSLGSERWQSLVDLCNAATDRDLASLKIEVIALASTVPPEAVEILRALHNLRVIPAPSHDDLPRYLKAADILFLPESFDPLQSDTIRLSISSKSHLYMFSKRPVLVYGAPIAGVVQYALREKWALVVQSRDKSSLQKALYALAVDIPVRKQLIETGAKVAARNHDETVVRARFRAAMLRATDLYSSRFE